MKFEELLPASLTLAIGIPFFIFFVQAIRTSETARVESPVRALLGDQVFEALSRGQKTEQHYLGNTRPAPDFTLKDRFGKEFRLSQHRGRLVILNFWTITCPPCIEEMPSLEALARALESRGDVAVVTVSTDAGWEAVKGVVPSDSRLKILFDPEKRVVTRKYGTRLFPETFIIDDKGIIRLRYDGARDWSDPLTMQLIEFFLKRAAE
jgi:peroxiredoxin